MSIRPVEQQDDAPGLTLRGTASASFDEDDDDNTDDGVRHSWVRATGAKSFRTPSSGSYPENEHF